MIWYRLLRPPSSLQHQAIIGQFTLTLCYKKHWQVHLTHRYIYLPSVILTLNLEDEGNLEVAKLRAEEYFSEYLERTKREVDSALQYLLEGKK